MPPRRRSAAGSWRSTWAADPGRSAPGCSAGSRRRDAWRSTSTPSSCRSAAPRSVRSGAVCGGSTPGSAVRAGPGRSPSVGSTWPCRPPRSIGSRRPRCARSTATFTGSFDRGDSSSMATAFGGVGAMPVSTRLADGSGRSVSGGPVGVRATVPGTDGGARSTAIPASPQRSPNRPVATRSIRRTGTDPSTITWRRSVPQGSGPWDSYGPISIIGSSLPVGRIGRSAREPSARNTSDRPLGEE